MLLVFFVTSRGRITMTGRLSSARIGLQATTHRILIGQIKCTPGSREAYSGGANANQPGSDDLLDGEGLNDQGTPNDRTDGVYSNVVDSEHTGANKHKRGDALDGLIDVIGKLHEDTNARLDRLLARIGYEFDVTKARKDVFHMMGLIPRLTLSQVFIASDAILARVERLDYFMSLPEGARQLYVWHALEHYTGN
ncbi:uncharacterized protein LOC121799200 [Salvia splendens]|nr:uncharacterized protein LOC121799200 [Salvia splendens]